MGNFRSNAIGRLILISAFAGLVVSDAAAVGYLAKVGPAPLRFQPVRAQKALVLPPLPAVPPAPPDVPKTPEAPLNSQELPPQSGFVLPGSPLESLMENPGPYSLLPTPLPPQERAAEVPAANDLLVVTPQMLIEYFRPSGNSTNGAGASVVLPLHFTPATPSAPPAQSSRAIYKSQ